VTITKMVRMCGIYAGAFDRIEARTRQKVPQRCHPKLLKEKEGRALAELAIVSRGVV
jgi:hypothetical protein